MVARSLGEGRESQIEDRDFLGQETILYDTETVDKGQ